MLEIALGSALMYYFTTQAFEIEKKPPINSLQLEDQPFIGMWSDRPETQNSTQWVRNIRQQHWHQ